VTLKIGVMMLKIQFCHHRIKLCLKIFKQCLFYFIFDQINAALLSIRYFFRKSY